jgi:hypothetical protein
MPDGKDTPDYPSLIGYDVQQVVAALREARGKP